MTCVALGSKATFHFQPSIDDIMDFKGIRGEKARKIAKIEFDGEHKKAEKEEISKIIIEAEKELKIVNRKVQGDASEAGLIKFVQPIMDLLETRAKYPVYSFQGTDGNPQEAMIPFSSEIKFNMYIRDMRNRTAGSKTDTPLMLVLKGAPERIISRCSKILIEG